VVVADPTHTPQTQTGQPDVATPGAVAPLAGEISSALSAVTGTKPRPEPLDPPMVPFALAGLGAFLLAGLVGLIFRDWLADHGHTDWLWICLGGFLVGLPGLATMIRHDRHRRARRALTHPEVREL
jgi:drug/metabolite transporter (DMT)-like permease